MNTKKKFEQLMEEAEARQRVIEQNGNSGLHYDQKQSQYSKDLKKYYASIGLDVVSDVTFPEMANKYKVKCKGAEIDVYDVLDAFKVTNPAIQHAIKKLLKGGARGYKDKEQDYNEAIKSINRGIELIK